jgi:hypothetical protein
LENTTTSKEGLNQADFSKERFQPGIDTSRIEQLAIKVYLYVFQI